MKFNINAYQHFYLKHTKFQEIWKSQSLKIFTFKKKCHYFCTGVYPGGQSIRIQELDITFFKLVPIYGIHISTLSFICCILHVSMHSTFIFQMHKWTWSYQKTHSTFSLLTVQYHVKWGPSLSNQLMSELDFQFLMFSPWKDIFYEVT